MEDARGIVSHQFTVSIAFDNWQCSIQKIWQAHGCSSIYLKGVAPFLKKGKAILLLVESIFKLPLGLRFIAIVYFVQICGEMVSRLVDADVEQDEQSIEGSILTRDTEITCVHSGSLALPTFGWDVISLLRVMPAKMLSYVHLITPPPLNACISIESVLVELLFVPGLCLCPVRMDCTI
jgi:hypothetical protein